MRRALIEGSTARFPYFSRVWNIFVAMLGPISVILRSDSESILITLIAQGILELNKTEHYISYDSTLII